MRLVTCLLTAAVLLGGCASLEHYTAWEGHSRETLVRSWGTPNGGVDVAKSGVSISTYQRNLCRVNIIERNGMIEEVRTNGDWSCNAADVAKRLPPPE